MFLLRRIVYMVILTVIAFVALDTDKRETARALVHDGYAAIAGRAPPLPLKRPLFLAQAGLDDCLRGTATVASDNETYAAFCADLASFAASIVAPDEPEDEGRDETEKQEYARAPETAGPPAVQCRVDASGAVGINTDGIWTSPPERAHAGSPPGMRGGKSSRIVLVPQGCDVESPADAKVLYAGPFKGYLGIVILDAGKTERLIVAGLGEIAVQRGDSIARGAKIGATSQSTAPALASAETAGEAALLYVEDASGAGPSG
ncbi:M23 family metallopeptidase [Parvibaculum sp.]|uniref:peptidoglycan DD-metalloendopeptidase family protein n=1 Tax=Parvibaculum sp. TaxID=2024848 RepID=UPI001D8BAC4E|nr:M23 family metallopeptidase [Parvibaculum sp.]MBX3489534.1 M23 family metallopeptidase [Parvibaculum sp.]MCW5726510.1 M23 family metallopeptidase [Parvibaculum sp.]